ncbi:hypothetical protein H2203_003341 [Taxawa tesnikishii (nom. ined.)]|nr:hypothetical protein H2203_003341 [Dothideales sp. JES 119]
MAAQLEDLREQLRQVEQREEESQKQNRLLQARLNDAVKEQGRLEEGVHEHMERIEELQNEKKESTRAHRELEGIYEAERAQVMKDKEETQAREEELTATIQRLKETLAQRDLRANLEDDKRPSLSRALLQKDKIIEGLRLELAEAQIKLVEMENMGGGRLQELEKALLEARVSNARLMEDNESYQLMLSEKTLNGDFVHSDFLRPPSNMGSRPSTRGGAPSSSLADELESAVGSESTETRQLQSEIAALKDQNKALTLYVNNIISRLLQHSEFENILDKTPNIMAGPDAASARFANVDVDKDLPPPPPKDEPQGFLQRTKSVLGGRPKPRPLTQQAVVHSEPAAPVTENPTTAPRIPLGRSQSVRNVSGGHRRANTDWNPASVVNNIPNPLNVNPAAAARMPSASSVPTISETQSSPSNKENQGPAFDAAKLPNSKRNSMASSGGEMEPPASPPRSTTSSGERGARDAGAVMMGTKMRPLRLVQEAKEEEEERKKANRGVGWAGSTRENFVRTLYVFSNTTLRAAPAPLRPALRPLPLKSSMPTIPFLGALFSSSSSDKMSYPHQKSKEEWQAQLNPEQFRILREKGTEAPFTGKYDKHMPDAGVYTCAGCNAPLYKANHKFKSGCGWPAFFDAIPGAVTRHSDRTFGMERTEIVCSNCGGHLGHVFKGRDTRPRPMRGIASTASA